LNVVPADTEAVHVAAGLIKSGELVIVPTETVYGLAADALNPAAVAKIFAAKGRPNDNPLIVHVLGVPSAVELVESFPAAAHALALEFWPGPLTLVLPKNPQVPGITTAGLHTVAIRVPAQPALLELIGLTGPLAAPSANRFTQLSPTRVEHLNPSVAAHAAMVLDGGPCEVGLESTVLDLSGDAPTVLRPGHISAAQIEEVLGGQILTGPQEAVRRSPGLHQRHYAPKTRLVLVKSLGPGAPGLTFSPPTNDLQIQMPRDAVAYATALYNVLHRLDMLGVDEASVERPPDEAEWAAVNDRLRRAAHQI
jgi:L-threonylcarbamoyladenylate synthase